MFAYSKKLLLLVAILGVCPLWAQNTSVVRGKVTDSSHKAVVSAFVVVTSQNTSLMRAATTDDAGEFQITALPVGIYKVEITAEGFRVFEMGEVRANIGQVTSLDVVLSREDEKAAARTQSDAPLAETSSTQL